LTRIVSSIPPYHLLWSDWGAWVQICLALALLFFTAQVWLLLVGAFALRSFLYGVVLLIAGKELFGPHHPISRLEASAMAFFGLTTLLLLFRFHDTRPSILDRVALTFFVVAALFALLRHRTNSTLIDPRFVAGLIALAISWCVHRWKTTKSRG